MNQITNLRDGDFTIIYHRNCTDGFVSAWAAVRAINQLPIPSNRAATLQIDLFDCQYQEPFTIPDDKLKDRYVYILDFSFPREVMLHIKALTKKMVCLDHHKTAQKDLEDIEGCEFDMNRSGAMMTWNHFNMEAVPRLIHYVQDYDLWLHRLPATREINANIKSYPMTFENFDLINARIERNFTDFAREGEALLRREAQDIENALKNKVPMVIDGRRIWCVNNPNATLISKIGEALANQDNKYGMGGVFFMLPIGQWVISLRSREFINAVGTKQITDVSLICKKFGGGGHTGAAGFKTRDINQFFDYCNVIIDQVSCPNFATHWVGNDNYNHVCEDHIKTVFKPGDGVHALNQE